jgi:hypothetical protein
VKVPNSGKSLPDGPRCTTPAGPSWASRLRTPATRSASTFQARWGEKRSREGDAPGNQDRRPSRSGCPTDSAKNGARAPHGAKHFSRVPASPPGSGRPTPAERCPLPPGAAVVPTAAPQGRPPAAAGQAQRTRCRAPGQPQGRKRGHLVARGRGLVQRPRPFPRAAFPERTLRQQGSGWREASLKPMSLATPASVGRRS